MRERTERRIYIERSRQGEVSNRENNPRANAIQMCDESEKSSRPNLSLGEKKKLTDREAAPPSFFCVQPIQALDKAVVSVL